MNFQSREGGHVTHAT